MPRLITTSPTPSGTRHESGCHQSSTGTRTRTSGWSGQISRISSKNMQSRQTTNWSWRDYRTWPWSQMKRPTSYLPASPGLPESSGRALMTTFPKYLTHTTTSMVKSPTIHSGGSWGNTTWCRSTDQFLQDEPVQSGTHTELRSVVAQQEKETITIKKMYQVATTGAQGQRSGSGERD